MIDDEAARDLAIAFYARLRENPDAAGALRAAALELRADPRFAHPGYWAFPRVVSGGS
jgi:CHAT domain-containing protein